MNWIKKYRFKTDNSGIKDWNGDGMMDYLYNQPLNKFKFCDDITEEEFENLYLVLIDIPYNWVVTKNMVENVVKIRKDKLNGLD
jgi:hypothetical protein